MPESLPSNVIVFSGMQCSQPNLLKILMFPESPDTPYCGGCFEFDAFIPLEYPAVPPKCNLITTGECFLLCMFCQETRNLMIQDVNVLYNSK